MLEQAAFDKLVHDLRDHGVYFSDRWLLSGVAADCAQAAIELRNMRNELEWYKRQGNKASDIDAAAERSFAIYAPSRRWADESHASQAWWRNIVRAVLNITTEVTDRQTNS